MKCQIVKDPILKQITNGTKMKLMVQLKTYVSVLHKIAIFEKQSYLD